MLLISAGAILGAYIGAILNEHLSADTLRKIFAILLIIIAIKTWHG
jgi:uncharacterized membrane protein YfcA